MASISDIKNGLCINFNKEVYSILSFQHVKNARGAAFVRVKMKSFKCGKIIENSFNSSAKLDVVRVERRKYQFLYEDDMGMNFMETETYEQISIQKEMIDQHQFIKEGSEVEVLFDTATQIPLTVELPQYVYLKITYTEPGLAGNTATNAMKPATTETGAEIRVPLFINEGDTVKVESKTGNYMERAKV